MITIGVPTLVTGILLIAGCDDAGTASGGHTWSTPTLTLPAFASPLQSTAEAIALGAYATRSAVEVNAAEAAAQATIQAAIYQGTVEAAKAQEDQQRWLATQQAAHVTAQAQATQDAFAMQMTVQAQAIAATATERAYRATATAQTLDRQATATAQQRADMATATAQVVTAQAAATQQAREARATATAESHRATQVAYHATATRAAEEREIVLGYSRDYGIPLVLLVLIGCIVAFIVYAVRLLATRPVVIPRSPLGDAETVAVPVAGGGYTFLDPDLPPGPTITVLPDGTVHAPRLREPGQEERTKARDQLVDATTRPRLGSGQRAQPPALPMAPPPRPPAPGLRSVRMFRRLDQAGRVGAIPPPLLASLAADWETEPGEGI